jgi:hypothetical protein
MSTRTAREAIDLLNDDCAYPPRGTCGSLFGAAIYLDERRGGTLHKMAKTKISSTDLVWIFHQELQAFDDFPLHGISIAIVPTADGGWEALTPSNVQARRPLWASRVEAIQKRLQKTYILAS